MSGLVDGWEDVTSAMAERLVESWNSMREQIGDRPFDQEKLPERDFTRQYQLVRNDPQAWSALFQEHGYKRTTEYMLRGERLSKKYPDEAKLGQESVPPPMALPAQGAPSPGAPSPTATAPVSGGPPIPAEIPGQPAPVQQQ